MHGLPAKGAAVVPQKLERPVAPGHEQEPLLAHGAQGSERAAVCRSHQLRVPDVDGFRVDVLAVLHRITLHRERFS